jgi:hypothetical protein
VKAAALEYARAGIHVFPVLPNKKEPACARGFYDGTTDLDEIEDAWKRLPDANIGIATGASGLVVIDIDVKHGDDGWDALDDCMKRFGQLPGPTRMVSTPSDGAHIYFRAPEGVEIPSSAGQFKSGLKTPGLDVRASTGYVLAPPSVIDGKRYHWDITEPAKMLPRAWAQAMLPPKPRYVAPEDRPVVQRANAYGASVLNDEADTAANAQPGCRNDTLTSSAFKVGTIADQCGITPDTAAKVFAWAASQWGDAREAIKARDSFHRAFSAGRLSPRQLELSHGGQ